MIIRKKCPYCGEIEYVWIMDQGLNFFRRFFAGNNRLACSHCRIAWRRKEPEKVLRYRDISRQAMVAGKPGPAI